jgi:hypothetical protein
MLIMAFRGLMANQCSQNRTPSMAVGVVEAMDMGSADMHQICRIDMAGRETGV